jgi:hypothetical protein
MRKPATQPVEPRKSNRAQINFIDPTIYRRAIFNENPPTDGRDISMDLRAFFYSYVSSNSHNLIAYPSSRTRGNVPQDCNRVIGLIINCNISRNRDHRVTNFS